MSAYVPGSVPSELLHRPSKVLRPIDASGVYAHPRPEFARLVKAGALHRLATGYYAVAPPGRIGENDWLPDVESAAWGIAVADYGRDAVALMGISAARVHGAIPRAMGVVVMAVPKQRPVLRLSDRQADVVFVRRNVAALDVARTALELGDGWVTTIEQTLLDLVSRPGLGGMSEEAQSAIPMLKARSDETLLRELAVTQRRRSALFRLGAGA